MPNSLAVEDRHDLAAPPADAPPMPPGSGAWEFITPAKAAELLACMVRQRKVVHAHVDFLSRQIFTGLWKGNPEPLIINQQGELDEGQHRLLAIQDAGRGIWLYVMRGVANDVFDTLNTGRVRQGRDVISTSFRDANAQALATAAQWLHRYETDAMVSTKLRLSPQEIHAIVRRHQRLALLTSHSKELRTLFGAGPLTFLRYILTERSEQDAETFLSAVATGETERGTGSRELRERLQRNLAQKAKITAVEKIAITIKAWNIERGGRTIKVLAWRKSEPFPKLDDTAGD